MFDFRLKVFDTVAKRLSFTKAATELNITQPAVSKHIKEIEQNLNTRLFNRNGTKISLTTSGEILLKYTEKLFCIYRELDFEINQHNQKQKGTIRMGAITTIAQYVLPPLLAEFHKQFEEIQVLLTIRNTEAIEDLLQHQKIDLGLIEGQSKNKLFHYIPFIKDEIVLAARGEHPMANKNALEIKDLKEIPLLLREPGSGTLENIAFALKPHGVKLTDLHTEMQIGNTESIKSYLIYSDCMAFLSIHSILQELKNKTLTVIDLKEVSIERLFYFIQPQGEQSAMADLFKKFAQSYNFK